MTFGLYFCRGLGFTQVGNYNFHLARGQKFLSGMVTGFGNFAWSWLFFIHFFNWALALGGVFPGK